MKAMKILNNFQIMKNSNESCIAGQIFVHFSNVVLWATLIAVAFVVIFIPETPDKKFILGIQWHPEFAYLVDESSLRLIQAFVDSCCRK